MLVFEPPSATRHRADRNAFNRPAFQRDQQASWTISSATRIARSTQERPLTCLFFAKDCTEV